MKSSEDIKEHVRTVYSSVAKQKSTCCGENDLSACRTTAYSPEDMKSLPQSAANLSLGCGNPVSEACLATGEVVLDLGSGGGIDVFLAARRIGPTGKSIGVDFSEEMIKTAQKNAEKIGLTNVEFRVGELEDLPVDDESVDVIISNCVVNLSPDKNRVAREAFRVLKKGGRIAFSDKVARDDMPDHVRNSLNMWGGCIAGALTKQNYILMLERAEFSDITVEKIKPVDPWYVDRPKDEHVPVDATREEVIQYVYSALIKARK